MLEKIRKAWNKFWYGSEVRKVKVRAKDIQENILRIQKRLEWVHNDIDDITSRMDKIDKTTEDGQKKYEEFALELAAKNELVSVLQKEMEQEYTTLKKMKDSRFMMQPKDAIIIGGVIFLGAFMIALERENPKALKLCTFLLKLFPMHY